LGQSADGLGWVGSHKMDPWTTLLYLFMLQASLCLVLENTDSYKTILSLWRRQMPKMAAYGCFTRV